jgi:hypothetical protein
LEKVEPVIPVWVLIVGAIFLILGVKGGRRYRADLNKVSGDAFHIRTDTLVEKREESDSDGGTDYILEFSNGTPVTDSAQWPARPTTGPRSRAMR